MISFISRLLDVIAPRQCVMCGNRLSPTETEICSTCVMHLPRTHHADKPYDNEMAQCFWGLIPIEKAAALFYYQAGSETSRMIYRMKYGNRPQTAQLMGVMAAHEMAAKGFFDDIDVIVPVPLSKKRQQERGYNQSMEIARGVSSVTGLPVCNNAVSRIHFRTSQTHLTHFDRITNVSNVFVLNDNSNIAGKHILVIDDVMTTGATCRACAEQLTKAENIKISIMTLGYTKP